MVSYSKFMTNLSVFVRCQLCRGGGQVRSFKVLMLCLVSVYNVLRLDGVVVIVIVNWI